MEPPLPEKQEHGITTNVIAEKSAINEAVDIYGDVQTAQTYGYVARRLKSRHVQFIALGGTIGTGLFLGIGSALARAGPLSVFLGYTMTGIAIFAMMQCLGEMATWLPLPGAIPQFCARYIDEAAGFAVGWNNWYNAAIVQGAEIAAAAVLVQLWNDEINPAAWIIIMVVAIVAFNVFAVRIYGEAEFFFAVLKIITILGLLILALVLDLGGGPNHDRLGFRYWKNPGAMKEYIGSGDTGRFASVFSTLITASFSYGGVEFSVVTAGEAEDPRRNIPKAVRRIFWRILFFYVLSSLAIGVLVPYTDPNLTKGSGVGASPWVIAIRRAGIKGLPSVINAVVITSAASAANANTYVGSRYLFALAQGNQAPKFFLKCNDNGVPIYCVLFTSVFSLLAFMSVSTGANVAFTWLSNISTLCSLITWVCASVAFVRFKAGLDAQSIDRNSLKFKSPFQPYSAYFAIAFFSMIILGNGFKVFTHGNWSTSDFFVAYIGIPVFIVLFTFWKFFKGTRFVKAAEMDLWTGKSSVDAEDELWEVVTPRNFLHQIWLWVV